MVPGHGGGPEPVSTAEQREHILACARRPPDRERDGTATWSLSTLQQALAEMKAQLKVLDAQIAALTTQPELAAAARLRKVPGIGPVTASVPSRRRHWPRAWRASGSPTRTSWSPTSAWTSASSSRAARRASGA